LSIVEDELTKEIDFPQEGLHGLIVHWEGKLCDFFDPILVYLNPTFGNNVAQEITFGHSEDTFLGI